MNAHFTGKKIGSDRIEEGNLPFATTWMCPEGILLSEVNQTEKNRYCVISLTCEV